MKFLVVADYNWENLERVADSYRKIIDERERDPDSFTKVVFGAHTLVAELSKKTKDIRTIAILEADSEEQLINQIFSLAPERDCQIIPLLEGRKSAELWMGWKR